MTVIEQLRHAIESYTGPIPATGDSIEEVWFREAVNNLIALDRQTAETGEAWAELCRLETLVLGNPPHGGMKCT
jgi:hypothetical protein